MCRNKLKYIDCNSYMHHLYNSPYQCHSGTKINNGIYDYTIMVDSHVVKCSLCVYYVLNVVKILETSCACIQPPMPQLLSQIPKQLYFVQSIMESLSVITVHFVTYHFQTQYDDLVQWFVYPFPKQIDGIKICSSIISLCQINIIPVQ